MSLTNKITSAAMMAAVLGNDPSLATMSKGLVMFYGALDDGNFWKYREALRMATGQYEPLPEAWADINRRLPTNVFAHMSSDFPARIAWTMDRDKGMQDRQTASKPGKFLARFFPDMSPEDIGRRVSQITNANATVRIVPFQANNTDDLRDVSLQVSQTCMNRPGKYDGLRAHPWDAFSGSGFALAYITDRDGRATARAIVNTLSMRYFRTFGNASEQLNNALAEAGYEQDGNWVPYPVKLHARECAGSNATQRQLAAPYLDTSNDFVFGVHLATGDFYITTDPETLTAEAFQVINSVGDRGYVVTAIPRYNNSPVLIIDDPVLARAA